MRRPYFPLLAVSGLLAGMTLAGLILMSAMASAQSLGDVARETRESKAASQAATPSKVITNKDLTGDEDEDVSAPPNANQTNSQQKTATNQKAAAHRDAEQRAAVLWKQRVIAQKNRIATLQARADQIRASLQSMNAGNPYDGPAFTRYQAWQLDRLKQTQLQLDQQKQALADLQDAARRAGMHTAVYDP